MESGNIIIGEHGIVWSGEPQIDAEWTYSQGRLMVFPETNLSDMFETGNFRCVFVPSSCYKPIAYTKPILSIYGKQVSGYEIQEYKHAGYKVGCEENNNKRMVYPVVGLPNDLHVGLTVHSSLGSWSSWPPHAFEKEAYYSPIDTWFGEIFAFIMEPYSGWGIQLLMPKEDKKQSLRIVENKDIVHIPLGAHPVVASPNTRIAYFWAYYGKEDKFDEHGKT